MSSPLSVLIVDDMLDSRTLLRILFTHKTPYTVLEATNGQEALHLAQSHSPDLIILDHMMPDLSGLEVCQRLRNLPQTAAVPVLMLTARADQDMRAQALAAGANGFLTKPIRPKELLGEVERLLAESRAGASQ